MKYGIIKLAYQNKIPIQIIITSNKDKVMSQKKLSVGFGIKCNVFKSETFYPINYNSLDKWIEFIQKKWDESWNNIYSYSDDTNFEFNIV